MKKPSLSIIIPMYNVQNYLKRCVNSVFQQNIPEDEFEILMINDGSPDKSLEIASSIAQNHKNVKIISQENKGLGGARNKGIANASANYILFLDADDILAENALQKLLKIAENKNLDILEFAAKGIDDNGKETYYFQNKSLEIQNGISYYKTVRYMNSACNKLYKRQFLTENNLLFLEKIYIEDYEFNTKAFAVAQNVYATDLLGAYFLQSQNSITRNNDTTKKNKMIEDIEKVIHILHQKYTLDKNNVKTNTYYQEKLNYLTSTLFYKMAEQKFSYREVVAQKNKMQNQGVFYTNFPIYDTGKDVFRKIFLKNIFLFPLFSFMLKFIKK